MEQDGNQDEFVDLSQVLSGADRGGSYGQRGKSAAREEKMPGIYRLVFKFSFGVIKTEKQARAIVIALIILMNLVTFSLLFKDNGRALRGATAVPTQIK